MDYCLNCAEKFGWPFDTNKVNCFSKSICSVCATGDIECDCGQLYKLPWSKTSTDHVVLVQLVKQIREETRSAWLDYVAAVGNLGAERGRAEAIDTTGYRFNQCLLTVRPGSQIENLEHIVKEKRERYEQKYLQLMLLSEYRDNAGMIREKLGVSAIFKS